MSECRQCRHKQADRTGLYIMVFLAMVGAMNAATRSEVQTIVDKVPMCVMEVQQ